MTPAVRCPPQKSARRRLSRPGTQVAKWAKRAAHDADDIAEALEEALWLLDDPGTAYRMATPITRRMFNQALFERLLIFDGEVIDAMAAPWVDAVEAVAREPQNARAGREVGDGPDGIDTGDLIGARRDQGPDSRGLGLNVDKLVRMRGLEPPRPEGHRHLKPARLPFRHIRWLAQP